VTNVLAYFAAASLTKKVCMIDGRACTIKLLEESLIPYSSKLVALALSITYLLVCFQELLSTYAPICLIGRMGVRIALSYK